MTFEDSCLLGYNAVQNRRTLPAFQRELLPPTSALKIPVDSIFIHTSHSTDPKLVRYFCDISTIPTPFQNLHSNVHKQYNCCTAVETKTNKLGASVCQRTIPTE
jgi:hypothetical protein